MHILCIDDDSNFRQLMETEAQTLGIKISFAESLAQAQQKLKDENFSAQIINSKFRESLSLDKDVTLVYQNLPDIQLLKELKVNQKINFVSGKPMSSNEAHYLLTKLCKRANRLEPFCDWLHEIPKNLLDEFFNLSYERLTQIADLIQKIKEEPSPQVWIELQNIVHKIAGSAGIYGRSMASEISKEMEIRLKNKDHENLDLDSFYRQLYLYLQ
jgi:CheY-like chemotaxis protein